MSGNGRSEVKLRMWLRSKRSSRRTKWAMSNPRGPSWDGAVRYSLTTTPVQITDAAVGEHCRMIVDDGEVAITPIVGAGPPDRTRLRFWQEPAPGAIHLIYRGAGETIWVWARSASASIRVVAD